MKFFIIAILSIFLLGYLFVQWANKPENVAALQRKRALDAAQKIEDEKKQAAIAKGQAVFEKEIETKKGSMKLVIEENFAQNRFEKLDLKDQNTSYFQFEKNELHFSGIIYPRQNQQDYFIRSKDRYGDFIAEIQLGNWGGDAYTGIFWGANDNGNQNPTHYQAAYATPNTLYVQTDDKEDFGLGGMISSENNQLLRVERFGKHIKASVNGRVLFNKTVESAETGKVGIILGHRGGIRANNQSMDIGIKYFKVWN
ncbi:hypothetical protein [Spirosoma foliorum]|uniref:DUF1080 domain-containing protein n=1 Tax=Spirosoma foliorum TaxID=2710596 RepID=A0A7G5H4A5_9BACT|nr:hypothetical protein [Spirosoma foliorum]QMW05947.1 hypothetical protein H3H32_14135 [Spirosoma foliorum]